jgi:superfamily II DNA or RNA helicase
MSQWKTEIQTFLPTTRIGQIQGDTVKVNDCDIVIVMLQSLSRRNYPLEVFQDFKVLVVDEIQNIASKVFSKVLFKLCCKYTIGLSATPKRSDGCERVFEWHIGDIIYKSEAIQSGLPLVILRKVLFTENYKERVTDGKIQFTSMITDLVCNKERNCYIVNLVKDFLRDENRKILILSERRNHLEKLNKLLEECDSGLFLGGMKEKDLQETRKKRVILATFAAFSEGVSEKDLNTLILVTPKKYIGHLKNSSKNEKGSMTQICGRILRKSHTRVNPVIVDLQDNFSVFKSQNFGRNVFYKTYSTAIHTYENVDLHAEYIQMSNVNERNQECVIEDD